jgi:hypothetical protein
MTTGNDAGTGVDTGTGDDNVETDDTGTGDDNVETGDTGTEATPTKLFCWPEPEWFIFKVFGITATEVGVALKSGTLNDAAMLRV